MLISAAMVGAGTACFSDHGQIAAPNGAVCQIPLDPSLLGSTVVAIENFTFIPAQVTIGSGARVTWINCDVGNEDHTSTADQGAWDSSLLTAGPPSALFTFTFTSAGTFSYHCTPHPTMQGSVVVQ